MKEYNPLVMDNGLNELINNADTLWVIKNPVAGDASNNEHTALSGKVVASVALSGGDKSLSDYANGRQVTTAAKQDPAADDASIVTDDLHFALVDSVNSRVLAITNETTDQAITMGNPIDIPPINWKIRQPQ